MKTKEAQDFLKRIKKQDTIIRNKLIDREQLKDIAYGITSGGTSVLIENKGKKELHNMEKVQSSGTQSKMANAVERWVDLDAEINSLIDSLIDLKREVNEVIERLNTEEYDVLHKVYFQYMTFDEVAATKSRSKSWCTTVHGRALANVQLILNERKKKDG